MKHPKSSFFPDSFYRVTVKALIVKDGKILLIKEAISVSGKWEFPGGGLDFGEEIQDGLRRELEEEMGLKIKWIADQPTYAWTWRYENLRGMDWYYSLVLAYKVELDSFDFKTTDSCEAIGWFSKEELQNLEMSWQANGLKKVFDSKDFE